jgi:plastocyanin
MPDLSIKIVSAGARGKAAFVPDLQGAQAGDPLPAQQDDIVSWNNTTNRKHQPWPTDSNYTPVPDTQLPRTSPNYMSDPIPAGQSSRPGFDIPQTGTIYYCCKLHPKSKTERGTIVVTAAP